jgi:Type II secretion system (T2SS), protein M subtype b
MSPHAPTTAAARPARAAVSAHLGLWLWRHGSWLPLAVLLLGCAAGFGWQAWQLRAQARASASVVAAAPRAPTAPALVRTDPAAANLAALHQLLPPAAEATAQVRRLVELTRPQLAWQRAEFQHGEDTPLGLQRVQVTVPVAGEYAAMRQALDRSLAQLPHVSLDQVQLQRVQPDATQLEARLRFSIWLNTHGEASVPAR